jgi:hypothetical protein
MGREIKRVPLDFDWPMSKPWHGFTQPSNRRPCPDERCTHGYTPEGKMLEALAYLLCVPAGEDLGRRRHPWVTWIPTIDGSVPPMKNWSQLIEGLNGGHRQDGFLGFGSMDAYRIAEKLREAAGLPESWSICPTCGGDCEHPEDREVAEAERFDPPTGEGWQMWETVSEGSPITPVFPTPEGLAEFLTTFSWGAGKPMQYESALRWITGAGWAPSMVSTPETGLVDGLTFMVSQEQGE